MLAVFFFLPPHYFSITPHLCPVFPCLRVGMVGWMHKGLLALFVPFLLFFNIFPFSLFPIPYYFHF
ncbi:hypothetical protein Cenrod_0371 [Candidatus Symbiobacter mobilis CR]|uniref:Uncharacterized protein n=1 Tax=Candidatus Symbiobacter mobilis CR TaxID=946483 RepID=U5N8I6_9BURK|nr:hypothetical protein Cenrod_0371 [Candidatus Symbiobacter mobilis CR]